MHACAKSTYGKVVITLTNLGRYLTLPNTLGSSVPARKHMGDCKEKFPMVKFEHFTQRPRDIVVVHGMGRDSGSIEVQNNKNPNLEKKKEANAFVLIAAATARRDMVSRACDWV